MKIVAFLQNQWFRDPEGIKRMFAEHPERRERYISAFLFMGCLTGKRLQAVFGEELCDAIIWEEISPEIGGHASSKFPADYEHMQRVIDKHQPDVILAFGKLAGNAVEYLDDRNSIDAYDGPLWKALYGPHPAARNGAIEGLRDMRRELSMLRRQK